MRTIIEQMGETVAELVGALLVFGGLVGALVVIRTFGDLFISVFM